MNKIIILGNGFDLSHGLKTGFGDFIKDVIRERIDNPDQSREKLLSIINLHNTRTGIQNISSNSLDFQLNLNEFVQQVKTKTWLALNVSSITLGFGDSRVTISGPKDIFQYKNEFLAEILESENINNWVDFEKSYYTYLTRDLKGYTNAQYDKEDLIEAFNLLNKEFDELKDEFLKYLDKVTTHTKLKPIKGYEDLFTECSIHYSPRYKGLKSGTYPMAILILNFNYTNTIELYNSFHKASPNIINIHGELNSPTNPPIFGYGDEMDENYKRIESLDENEGLKHFKSFQYSKTANYRNLEQFIEQGPFNVDLIGHSCGLSDRVLLNYIFEHEHADTIRIIHHGGQQGHVNTYMNISRHFGSDNKAQQRSKVLGFDSKNACPQA